MSALRAGLLGSLVPAVLLAALGVGQEPKEQKEPTGVVWLAAVITPESSGLLKQLLGDFE